MELDSLPDNILLNIVSNFDLRQLIRYGRVNQRWQDLCQLIVETRIRHLDLTDREYWRMNAQAFARILRACSQNLQSITFPLINKTTAIRPRLPRPLPEEADRALPVRGMALRNNNMTTPMSKIDQADSLVKLNLARWCQMLAEFRFPSLRLLDLGEANTDRTCVESILASNQTSLETFRWRTPNPNGLEFGDSNSNPSSWTCSALREVDLGCLFATDALFGTLARNCPKLERFTANSYFRQWTAAGLDRLCGACPRLRVLNLKVSTSLEMTGVYVVPILFDPPRLTTDLTHFWELGQLRCLSLPFEGGLFDDETLYKISLCFPELRTLRLGDCRLSSDGVAHLRRLKQLRRVTMAQVIGYIDEGLLRLAAENRLEELNLALTSIDFPTLLAVVRHCPRLRTLNVTRNVSNYQVHRGTYISVQQAVQLIHLRRRMAELGECARSFTLVHTDPGVWTVSAVRAAAGSSSLVSAGHYENDEDADDEGDPIDTFRIVCLSDYCQSKCGDDYAD